jgi:hypothetical protein
MNPYANEDMAWQRLKDMQLEAENRRLVSGQPESLLIGVRRLGARFWYLAGLAMERPPRRSAGLSPERTRALVRGKLRSPNR